MSGTQTPWGRAAQLAEKIKQRGTPIVLRQLTRSAGPNPLLNPPRVTNPVVNGAVAPGATTIALRADYAMGQLLAGDVMLIAGQALAVAATAPALPVTANPPGFVAVTLASPVTAAIADGTPVALSFAADLPTYAMVRGYPVRLVDGERVQMRDLSLQIAAYGLPDIIQPVWPVLMAGREMSIQNADPVYERGEVMSWTVQAR